MSISYVLGSSVSPYNCASFDYIQNTTLTLANLGQTCGQIYRVLHADRAITFKDANLPFAVLAKLKEVIKTVVATINGLTSMGLSFLSRDAMLAWYMPWSWVCLSVCLSVTSRCSTETAKRRITQTTLHDSTEPLVFCRRRSRQNSNASCTPNGSTKYR